MKGRRFADTQESCFKAWNRSHLGCSALLCGRLADSQESCFQASKQTNMSSAVLEGGHSADIHEFCFQAAKLSDVDCVEMQVILFADCKEWHFQVSKRQIIGVPSCRRVDLLIFTNSGFRVRNDEIYSTLSSNEVYLLMVRNRFSGSDTIKNVQCSHERASIC